MTHRCQHVAHGARPGAATLFLTCGLQGAGKTTLARRLEADRPALRLTSDEWLHQLYPRLSPEELEPFRGTVESVQWEVAERALVLGCDVVVDWGLWSRKGRDQLRIRASELGVWVVLCLLDPRREVLWGRWPSGTLSSRAAPSRSASRTRPGEQDLPASGG